MTKSLLAISIGPVQPFIAAARKTRDFWCGSTLLSQVARAVAHSLKEQRAELIFPAPELLKAPVGEGRTDESVDADVANKVLARFEGDPDALAKAAEEAGRERLRAIAGDAFRRAPEIDKALAFQQLDSLLELYWAAVPLRDGQYKHARDLVERLLAARKNTRNFSSLEVDENRGRKPKCAIDGQREAVANVSTGERDRTEPLCGVCLVKRFAFGATSWSDDTTTHFAVKPAIAELKGTDEFKAFRGFFSRFSNTEVEASFFFEERLRSLIPEPELKDAQRTLRQLKDATRLQPSPYYALLRADGDHMGKAINACHDIESHQRLSERLVAFTQKAKDVVRQHHGRVVYAGGDDVLALLPVKDSIRCATGLADAFASQVTEQLVFPDSVRPTLSVGLVVAHHLDPLTDVIELSHRAEQAAKVHRNALAVLVSKRSGSDYLASGHWGTFDKSLVGLIEAFQQGRLPGGLPHELARIAIHTRGMDDDRHPIEEAELTRILARKRADKGNAQIDEATQSLVKLVPTEPERATLSSLVRLLCVARELASLSQGAR